MQFLKRHARTLLAVVCLLAAALWWGWDRIGPAVPEPPALHDLDPEVAELVGETYEAARRKRGDEELRFRLGQVYEANELAGYAQPCYETVLRARPDDEHVWYRLARVRERLGDLDGAIAALERTQAIAPDAVQVRALLGLWQLDAGRDDAARENIDGVLAVAPRNETALFGRIKLLLAAREPDAAMETLRTGGLLEGANAPYAYRLLATALRQRGDFADADRALARAGDARPNLRDPWTDGIDGFRVGARNRRSMASSLMAQGRFEEAAEILEGVRTSDPENTRVMTTLATCYSSDGDFDRAIEVLHEAFRVNGTDYWVNLALADTLLQRHKTTPTNLEAALAHATTATGIRKESAQAHRVRARILLAMGRRGEAIPMLVRSFELDAADPSVLMQAGLLLCEQRKWDEALATFELAIEHDPNAAAPMIGAALAEMERGDLDAAATRLEAARGKPKAAPGLADRVERRLAELRAGGGEAE